MLAFLVLVEGNKKEGKKKERKRVGFGVRCELRLGPARGPAHALPGRHAARGPAVSAYLPSLCGLSTKSPGPLQVLRLPPGGGKARPQAALLAPSPSGLGLGHLL